MELKSAAQPFFRDQFTGCSGRPRSASMRWFGALGLAAVFLFWAATLTAMAQTAGNTQPATQKRTVSLPHLYWHFLLYQNHLDLTAAQRIQAGKDASWLSNHFQQKLGFTDAQFAIVRTTAQRLESELKAVDAQARAFVQADRTANPRQPGSPSALRPLPPQLRALSEQHEALIRSEVGGLRSALGPDLAARLDAFLQAEIAHNVTVQSLHPLSPAEVTQHLQEAIQNSGEVLP